MSVAPPAGRAGLLVAIFILAAALYLNTLGHGFVWDDHELLSRAADWRTTWRPVKRLTILLDRALVGEDPRGYHLTNVILHGLASVLVTSVVARYGRGVAVMTGVLFAVHPVHVEAVACVAHRKEMLALMFVCTTLLAARAAATRPWLWGVAACSFVLGLGSKEVAAVMTPALVLVDSQPWGSVRVGAKGRGARSGLVGIGVLLAAAIWLHSPGHYFDAGYLDRISEGATSSYAPLLLTTVAALAWDVGIFARPWPLYLDRHFPLASSWLDGRVLLGVASAVGLGWLAWRFRARRDVGYGVAWFALTLLPVSGILPLSHWLVAERFLYVPSVGLCLIVAGLVDQATTRWPRRRRLLYATFGLLAVGLATMTVIQNGVWRDEGRLWTQTLRYHSASYRAHRGVGSVRLAEGDFAGASEAYQRALAINPRDIATHHALAQAFLGLARPEEALPHILQVTASRPDKVGSWILQAEIQESLGRSSDVLMSLNQALAADGSSRPALYALAQSAHQGRHFAAARGYLERLLAAYPTDAPATALLGLVELRAGRAELAEPILLRAIQLDDRLVASHRYLAGLLLARGDVAGARAHLDRAHQIDPRNPPAQELLDRMAAPSTTATPAATRR